MLIVQRSHLFCRPPGSRRSVGPAHLRPHCDAGGNPFAIDAGHLKAFSGTDYQLFRVVVKQPEIRGRDDSHIVVRLADPCLKNKTHMIHSFWKRKHFQRGLRHYSLALADTLCCLFKGYSDAAATLRLHSIDRCLITKKIRRARQSNYIGLGPVISGRQFGHGKEVVAAAGTPERCCHAYFPSWTQIDIRFGFLQRRVVRANANAMPNAPAQTNHQQ